MTEDDKTNYYVYIYFDPFKPCYEKNGLIFDFEPIYIGCGTKNRWTDHLRQAKNKEYIKMGNRYKFYKLKQIIALGKEPIIIKYRENLTRLEAFSIEKDLVEKIGRSNDNTGPLTNLVEGGRVNPCMYGEENPMFGKPWTSERRRIHSEKLKEHNKKLSEEEYNKRFKERKISDETRKKISVANTGKNNANYGKKHTTEIRERISRSNKGKMVGCKNHKAKTWIVHDPNKNVIEIKALHTFCREHGLCADSLKSAGRRNTVVSEGPSKGWSASLKP